MSRRTASSTRESATGFSVPLLALFAAACALHLLGNRSRVVRAPRVMVLLLIALPTLPQRRTWEYHNLLVGGSGGSWRYFADESGELGQRSDELIAFWKRTIKRDNVLYGYPTMREQLDAEHLKRWEPTPEQVQSGTLNAWFVFRAPGLPDKRWEHIEPCATPNLSPASAMSSSSRLGPHAVCRGRHAGPRWHARDLSTWR